VTALWSWLTTPPTYQGVLDAFTALYLVVFALGFVASAYLSGPRASQPSVTTRSEGLRRWATTGAAVFGAGLFFFAVRALQINPLTFGAPIWMVACVIVLLIFAARFVLWWKRAPSASSIPLDQGRIGLIGSVPEESDRSPGRTSASLQ
jgi:hypothetical protein